MDKEDSEVSDFDDGALDVSFWEPAPGTKVTRVHIQSFADPNLMSCGTVQLRQCLPMSGKPEMHQVCLNCLRVRPEAAFEVASE